MMSLRTLAPVLLAVGAACGSTAPSRFFALTTLEADGARTGGAVALVVDPVQVAEYLQRTQMVRRTSAVELEVDEYSRWAEPLDQALTRVLTRDLRVLLGEAGAGAREWRVRCRVTRFEADAEGRAVLEADYRLTPSADPLATRTGTWLARTPLAERGDPAALAAALDGLVHDFARALAAEISGG